MTCPARDIAVEAIADRNGNVSAHLRRLLDQRDLSRLDRALAGELTRGVVRHLATIDAVLKAFLRRPKSKMTDRMRNIIRVELYQLIFLDRIPAFAAVDQAVKQVRSNRRGSSKGLVNAIGRGVARSISEIQTGSIEMSSNIVPVGNGKFRTFDKPVLPDPQTDMLTYISQAYSLPEKIVARWLARFQSPAKVIDIALACNTRPPLIARVNLLRSSVDDAIAAIVADDAQAHSHSNGLSVVIENVESVSDLTAFKAGLIHPQDPTSTACGIACNVKPGMRVLDFCAAPGTKTTHLAERMQNQGSIVAVDVSREKLDKIEENCRRAGATIVTTMLAENAGSLDPASFDLVLADVPCCNTGVLARRIEVRWRFDLAALNSQVQAQRTIGLIAGQFVAPGGSLVYSTCSIENEECSHVAKWIASQVGHLKVKTEKLTLPSSSSRADNYHDGGYFAVLQ